MMRAEARETARLLRSDPDLLSIEPDLVLRPMAVPNDPYFAQQWHYHEAAGGINLPAAWDITTGSNGITVAVIDTGVVAHADLGGRLVGGFDFIGDTAVSNDGDGRDGNAADPGDYGCNGDASSWHGTHVAGTIGGLTNNGLGVAGMAFNVSIMPVKVIGGDWDIILALQGGTDDSVAQGIRYAVDNGARVLNMSIGRTGPPSPVIQSALTYAVSQGAFAAVAAGNDFLAGNPIERPADLGPQIEGVITVGAIGRTRTRASYSSTGSYVEIAAPGGDQFFDGDTGGILQQTFDFDFAFPFSGPPRFDMFTYFYAQGTSMATAHVTGFAALLMQQGITNPAAIEAAMKRYATDLGPSGRDDQFGNGLINVRATLRGMGLAK